MPLNIKNIFLAVAFAASLLINQVPALSGQLNHLLGVATDTTPSLTIEPAENETLELPFKPDKITLDKEAETKMLGLLNAEREKAGLNPLKLDVTLTDGARAHSADMWQRQYFAHSDLEGHSPFDRMQALGIQFTRAGENLALAHDVDQAHTGLMNSPGHRKNILDPDYTRVGIGVLSGGRYGEMFTQDFAD